MTKANNSDKSINNKSLQHIIDEMVEAVTHSQDEVFEITEQAREEFEMLSSQLVTLKDEIKELIDRSELVSRREKVARQRLATVSENFNVYSEEEIRNVYEEAHDLQSKHQNMLHREKALREQRDYIERRLKGLETTIERAGSLVSKISVILNYLTVDFKEVSDLVEDAKQKQMFGLKIIEAQEEERLRMSREIHDGPAQMLANVLIRSDLVEKVYQQGNPDAAFKEIKSMKAMVRKALYEVRRIIYDLRPMALDDLGLVPTIRKYLQTTAEYHDKVIRFKEQSTPERVAEKYEVALFRLIQEAVQNAIKHAEAKEIVVNLSLTATHIHVLVKDDGKGFVLENQEHQSFGLIGMRERVELLEGDLSIKSEIDRGTQVSINIPLKKG